MVTDKTLTNVQIDAVYLSAQGPGTIMQADADLMQACTVARNTHGDFTHAEQAAARKVVAEAYNARITSKAEAAASAATTPELDEPLAREPHNHITPSLYRARPATYHAVAVHWDEYGKPRAKHPPCLICGADEIGSLYDGAWCHCCQWRGPLLALLAHAKERTDTDNALVALTEEHDRLSSSLEQAARDGEEFHRMQATILAVKESGPWESPGITGVHRELYIAAWDDVFGRLIDRLRSEGLMPS